ncbi:MAG: hypothetical protein WKG07_11595 [Hymenobacter sp.]
MISASAIGIYGDAGDTLVTEETPPGAAHARFSGRCGPPVGAGRRAGGSAGHPHGHSAHWHCAEHRGRRAAPDGAAREAGRGRGAGQRPSSTCPGFTSTTCAACSWPCWKTPHWRGTYNAVAPNPVTNQAVHRNAGRGAAPAAWCCPKCPPSA